MSSPIDRGDAAPSSESAEQQTPGTPEASASETSQSAGEDARRKGPPIRIGSQRYGVKPPPAVPRPINAPAPVAKAALEPREAHPKSPLPQAAAAATDETPATQPTAAEAPTASAEATHAASGGAETTGGSPELAHKPAAAQDAASAKLNKKQGGIPMLPPSRDRVALPNLRAGLSEDLELEYLEALGGQSIDQVIADESKGAPKELEPDSRHQGRVIAVHRDNVFVDLGSRQQGVVGLKNFAAPPEVGTLLDVVVAKFDPAEGLYELTLPGGAVSVGDWSEVSEGLVVEAKITGHNKGGLECEVSQLRGFIPASQVSMYRVEDLSQFVGEKWPCVVTEANPEKRNLVLSRRAVLEREKAAAKETLLATLEVGKTFEGTVRSLQNFGAFVDLGGVDGLVHISQLSWDRIRHADEVLEVGQKIKVKILKIDPQTGKIALGFRDLSENPWEHVARDFPARATVKGKVSRVTEFGAFVRLAPGVEGLVHISELSHKRVFRVTDVLSEGQEVDVMVLSVDPEQQRISLSTKALEAKAAPVKQEPDEPAEPEAPPAPRKERKVPLKGGTSGPATGAKFGLKW
jgi:small subunit ribosomal protein S1